MSITDANVKAIIDTARDTTPFINTATIIADTLLSGKGLNSDLYDQIILYLTAHFVCITEESGGLKRSKLGDSDESYNIPSEKDSGFAFTRYGQQAMILDTTGTLAANSANKGLKAQIEVI